MRILVTMVNQYILEHQIILKNLKVIKINIGAMIKSQEYLKLQNIQRIIWLHIMLQSIQEHRIIDQKDQLGKV